MRCRADVMQDFCSFAHLNGHLTDAMRPILTKRVSREGVNTAKSMLMRFALHPGEFFVMDSKFYFAFSAAPAEWCKFDRQPYRSLPLSAETPGRNHRPRALVTVHYMPGVLRSEVEGTVFRGFIPIKKSGCVSARMDVHRGFGPKPYRFSYARTRVRAKGTAPPGSMVSRLDPSVFHGFRRSS